MSHSFSKQSSKNLSDREKKPENLLYFDIQEEELKSIIEGKAFLKDLLNELTVCEIYEWGYHKYLHARRNFYKRNSSSGQDLLMEAIYGLEFFISKNTSRQDKEDIPDNEDMVRLKKEIYIPVLILMSDCCFKRKHYKFALKLCDEIIKHDKENTHAKLHKDHLEKILNPNQIYDRREELSREEKSTKHSQEEERVLKYKDDGLLERFNKFRKNFIYNLLNCRFWFGESNDNLQEDSSKEIRNSY